MLDKIRVVLVGTSHPGNIGSAARAMKVMGLTNLVLVDPACEIDGHTIALAAGAADVVENAKIVKTLDEAVADCGFVVGSSARSRTLEWPQLDPRENGIKVVAESNQHPVAILFGRERTGLTNEELQKCHCHVYIPANPEYSSLNLAMAVQTVSYEVRMAYLDSQKYTGKTEVEEYPRAQELEMFYEHLEKVTRQTRFINKNHPGVVMAKLRRLFTRARPEQQELNILRGILSSVEKTIETLEKTEK
ncbi:MULTISPECIES: tRNA (cytosine(32)/uridine(32)-2'-O)-methyltransferase TrmJ [unclassified Photobacterium]|uniref:tRNA (cytosine(32)/uridine(32)-2'-O)-methyltransferase TrmJ n=1 Tax=unclassified Photobacterium TaxID=2628852 RepID=UPI000D15A461|nr:MULTISPECIES: tRNA (cytosine(32)/uridine(32)-2'-O)-methyltransferase TrmJ [unclassified Photobacterium]PSV25556.1 tRNA (cytosine(32)/uridine(32)-2'-O)-methyltransferase TrmJ [Photobacterium sp. GB-56]PSV29797.1 tRNA (cytosine(32)/uridine(32)-2'-O)-methyltransferase TrmJ [Photobacterium sp. GB-72]PSV37849.1 tRNA (cytosine(32)/uridine(32)-2'-O)-methyltransferase TrmJ [Photobacterium sp. GB-27]PSV39711.1 tRNA (cytosine(32)/uridine(32)-2'-O)-methyltransferase TrmJ [Photobacterium sp. GB-210]PSV